MINWKFVFRGGIFAMLIVAGLLLIAGVILHNFLAGPPDGPLPALATLTVPAGDLPVGHVGLGEWAEYEGEQERLVGSAFFFALADGTIIGAATAHSVALRDADIVLQRITLITPGNARSRYEMDTLYGAPGKPRWGANMNGDYVLLLTDDDIDSHLVLTPDPRGKPEPGERVVLYSGLGESAYWGTVHTVETKAVWILMDETFDPGRMSGSPILSAHTGKLVGMALAAVEGDLGLFIGISPVEILVGHAELADEFPKLSEFKR